MGNQAMASLLDGQLRHVAVVTRGVQRVATLQSLLDEYVLHQGGHPPAQGLNSVLAWGRKRSAVRAQRVAARYGVPTLQVEDGFLRSVGLGDAEPPLSIVVDDIGIYYDATAPSRLETLISADHTAAERDRATALAAQWRSARVSKFNHAREADVSGYGSYVLAIDQTYGDASIRYGLAAPLSFMRMVEAALDENPGTIVLLKMHPEVLAGRKRGHFDLDLLRRWPQVRVLAEDVHPPGLLEHAERVYTVTSQLGFEALLWGKQVRTFGMPFYAGWGLTDGDLPVPARRKQVAFEDLVYAALVEYPRYLDPETGTRCEVERLLEHIALQRRMRERFPPRVYGIGVSLWKRGLMRTFFQGSAVRFVRRAQEVPPGAMVAVWGHRPMRGALRHGTSVIHVEDGFLRSVGLGADLVRPLSWVADSRGIYYDATAPSDLEHLLSTTEFDATLLERARRLRERIVALGLTKYNVGAGLWQRPAGERSVILVPGQVEKDASIRYGAPGVRTNLDLLCAVREARPDAWIVYKPHPDVVAGIRAKGIGEDDANAFCDEIVTDIAMGTLLDAVDEVHVLTSLAGFEALLRGKRVVTYGQPFYAGWDLTTDRIPIPRRRRRLNTDELVAGVLILYPVYVSRVTGRYTTPERALDELVEWKAKGANTVPVWRKAWRLFSRMWGL